ncbi:GIN domain-containing protein [Massilia sp. S19_KUP03_FR1]|uniref:GIN domain-containing protein n=1 Tax=Massilia sp. S19_KUP03_FR1 TaxID=3025503 RepID=UPI002FCD7E4E
MRHLTLAIVLALTATLVAAPARAAEQARTAAAFTAIDLKGPISIDVQAGKAQAITVRGSQKFIGMVVTDVVNGELRIYLRENEVKKMHGDPRVVITVPSLHKFSMEGAGETVLRDISGERFEVNYRGAGRMDIAGKVRQLTLQAQGVGEVDARRLVAQDADVNFQGIGSVQIYASGRLDARVQGMGELRYYGHPTTLNKSVSGIGSVKAGD